MAANSPILNSMLCGFALTLFSVATPAPISAQASVQMHVYDSVGRRMDGTVTLRRGTTVRTCQTVTATCEIRSVAAGTYTATLRPVRESPPNAIQVQVPVAGVLTLNFRSVPLPTTSTAATNTTVTSSSQPGSSQGGSTAGGARPSGHTAVGQSTVTTMSQAVSGSPGVGMSAVAIQGIHGQVIASGLSPTMTTVAMAPACISGQLLSSVGRPTPGSIEVTAGGRRTRVSAGADGRFSVCGVSPGQWSVMASAMGTVRRQVRQVSPGTTLTVRLPQAVRRRPTRRIRRRGRRHR